MEYDTKLNDDLMQMGMHNAFVSWDFERLVEGGTLISYVKHKAVVQVNEEGTVAAAVSAVAVASAGPPSFDVNRPFFFAIHDKETGVILFMGVVYEPEALGEPTS